MRYIFLLFITTFSFAQQTQKVDFISMRATINLLPSKKMLEGAVYYEFTVLSSIDTIKIDAKNMVFSEVRINDTVVNYKNSGKSLQLFEGFHKGKNTVKFNYTATPKQTLYFTGEGENLQIWTQGQGKDTSHWLPSFDDVNEKVIFNLHIIHENNYAVISNGKYYKFGKQADQICFNKTNKDEEYFQFGMQNPMSSYLLMIAIGKFEKQILKSKSGIPLELYLKPEDHAKFASTYKYSKEIFDFFETEIGVKYPWKIYKQVPVNDFLYAGMENTSATIFSQDFVVDDIGFNDRNYINVNAHELAHQWFGDMITAKSSKDHWLQEGFATYYALLAEKVIFGDNYFNYRLLQNAEELQEASKTDTIPILNPKASSLSFYKKGAWALHVLREGVGAKNFQKAVKNYLKKYQFKNVVTDDFLAEIKNVSDYDVANFKKNWLEKSGFNANEAIAILSKNEFIRQYLDIQKKQNISFTDKKNQFETILKSNAFYPIKQEFIYQLASISFDEKKELLRLAMQSNDVQVRRAVAQTVTEIPLEFKQEYETLLDDKSYVTREIALQNLWTQFPEERIQLLEKTRNWVGANDKSLRIAWLGLALQTANFQVENQFNLIKELVDYTTPKYDSSIRQNALELLLRFNFKDEIYLQSLVNATTHHKWQFVKFGKETIRKLLKNDEFRKLFNNLAPKLSDTEKASLERLLKE